MDTDPGQAQPATDDSQPKAETLRAYVAANYGKYTDEALTAELLRAGYTAEEIRAALADAGRTFVQAPTGRAISVILIAYAATFAILSLGMLANVHRSGGCCAPDAAGGITILAASLGLALLLSFLWVGSRRVAALLLAGILGLSGMGLLASDTFLAGLVLIGIAIGLAALVLRRGPGQTRRSTTTLAALLSVPVILLVIIAGLCVATGLPIPTAG